MISITSKWASSGVGGLEDKVWVTIGNIGFWATRSAVLLEDDGVRTTLETDGIDFELTGLTFGEAKV